MSNVLIILFSSSGYDRAAQGLAGAGRRLADSLGVALHAVCIGPASEALTAQLASVADEVVVAAQPELQEYQPETCLAALSQLCREASAQAVLLGNDAYSQELAPRLAHRLGGSAVGDGIEVAVQAGRVRVKRGVYGGKAVATV